MVAALAERLKADPGNAEGWLMLGRSYAALGRHRCGGACRKAVALMPGNANVLADLADVIGHGARQATGRRTGPLVQQALAHRSAHVKALALAGSAAFEAKDYRRARPTGNAWWRWCGPDSEMARGAGQHREATQLEAAASGKPGPAAAAASAPQPAAAAAGIGHGEVVLAPELAARVAAGDTVYVFARAAQGPRMPLAILRQPVGSWPLRFTLDDSSAMTPELRLSGQRRWWWARASRAAATPRPAAAT
jgi:cytochrome c-type biogenesis protein CcmH